MAIDLFLVEIVLPAVLSPQFSTVPSDELTANEIEMLSDLHCGPEHFLDGFRIISSEISDGIMIRLQISQQPHYLDIPLALFFQVSG
ncbi:MAG: hypothetical protein M0Q51_14115 [Bacteroidales bacterium]|nr:hypothetical protein [Bacteroidales bacterium]